MYVYGTLTSDISESVSRVHVKCIQMAHLPKVVTLFASYVRKMFCLIKTRELLSSCNCDSACHKCLKHYRNQYVHGLLDRSAALDLLTWAEKGVRSPMLPVYEQRNLLQSVEQILQFSGVHIDFDHEPIEAESFHGKKRIVVYPAMWARPTEKNMVFVSDSYLKYAKPYALKTIVGGL